MLNRKLMIELLLKSKRVCVVIYNFEIIKSRSSFTRSILRCIVRVQIPPWTNVFSLKKWCRCISSSGSLCTNNEIFIYSLPKNNIPDYVKMRAYLQRSLYYV